MMPVRINFIGVTLNAVFAQHIRPNEPGGVPSGPETLGYSAQQPYLAIAQAAAVRMRHVPGLSATGTYGQGEAGRRVASFPESSLAPALAP